ncbi:MAG TPA: hypothetical protein VM889_00310 [Candidatus Thermoplasmatota archaeon]|nr:hypothetical protein [Candidatus Thermoplasmatota archaeon]
MPRTLAVLALLLLVVPAALANHGSLRFEAEEPSPASRQRTCVPEALAWPDVLPGCEPVVGLGVIPDAGVPILDAMLWTPGVFPAHPEARVATSWGSGSPDRETGVAPALVAPGLAHAVAFYGFWADENGNGIVDQAVVVASGSRFERYEPGNEFVPAIRRAPYEGALVAFLEPGAHPPVTASYERPAASEPDVRFAFVEGATRLHRADAPIVLLDGSLLETYTMETVAEAVLVPDWAEGRHYRPEPWSRVDVDVYAALAPGPVAALYAATAAPLVRDVGSPGLGACPEGCSAPPAPAPGAGAVVRLAYAAYEDEVSAAWLDDPRRASTNAGRLATYQERYAGWIDVMPMLVALNGGERSLARTAPLPAAPGAASGLAVPPGGLVAAEVRTGLWFDATGDGFVGAVGEDPYDGGNRPIAHRYRDSAGEFVPVATRSEAGFITMRITLTPDATWGDPGILLVTPGGAPAPGSGCEVLADPCISGYAFVEGSESVVLEAWPVHDQRPGHLLTTLYVLFPAGTAAGGFTVCTDLRALSFREGGLDVVETLRDCDHVERLAP